MSKKLLKIYFFVMFIFLAVFSCIHKPDDPFNDSIPETPVIQYEYVNEAQTEIRIYWNDITEYKNGDILNNKKYIVYKNIDGKTLEFETLTSEFYDNLFQYDKIDYFVTCKDTNNIESSKSNVISFEKEIYSPTNLIRFNVDSSGGSFKIDSQNNKYDNIEIEIPENALDSVETIELESIYIADKYSLMINFSPNKLSFNIPIKIKIPFSSFGINNKDEILSVQNMVFGIDSDDIFEYSIQNDFIVFEVKHFSLLYITVILDIFDFKLHMLPEYLVINIPPKYLKPADFIFRLSENGKNSSKYAFTPGHVEIFMGKEFKNPNKSFVSYGAHGVNILDSLFASKVDAIQENNLSEMYCYDITSTDKKSKYWGLGPRRANKVNKSVDAINNLYLEVKKLDDSKNTGYFILFTKGEILSFLPYFGSDTKRRSFDCIGFVEHLYEDNFNTGIYPDININIRIAEYYSKTEPIENIETVFGDNIEIPVNKLIRDNFNYNRVDGINIKLPFINDENLKAKQDIFSGIFWQTTYGSIGKHDFVLDSDDKKQNFTIKIKRDLLCLKRIGVDSLVFDVDKMEYSDRYNIYDNSELVNINGVTELKKYRSVIMNNLSKGKHIITLKAKNMFSNSPNKVLHETYPIEFSNKLDYSSDNKTFSWTKIKINEDDSIFNYNIYVNDILKKKGITDNKYTFSEPLNDGDIIKLVAVSSIQGEEFYSDIEFYEYVVILDKEQYLPEGISGVLDYTSSGTSVTSNITLTDTMMIDENFRAMMKGDNGFKDSVIIMNPDTHIIIMHYPLNSYVTIYFKSDTQIEQKYGEYTGIIQSSDNSGGMQTIGEFTLSLDI